MFTRYLIALSAFNAITWHSRTLGDEATAQSVFESETCAYRITLPEGWVRIPRTSLAIMTKNLFSQSAASTIVYDAAFQSSGETPWFTYPYAAIQIVTYDSLGLPGQPTERDLDGIVRALTRIDLEKQFSRTVRSEVNEAIDSVSKVQGALLDRPRRRYSFEYDLAAGEAGVIHGRTTGVFGCNTMAMIHFNAPKVTWATHEPTARKLADAFVFNGSAAYDESLAAPVLPLLFRLPPGIGGPIAVGLVIGFATLVVTCIKAVKRNARSAESSEETA